MTMKNLNLILIVHLQFKVEREIRTIIDKSLSSHHLMTCITPFFKSSPPSAGGDRGEGGKPSFSPSPSPSPIRGGGE